MLRPHRIYPARGVTPCPFWVCVLTVGTVALTACSDRPGNLKHVSPDIPPEAVARAQSYLRSQLNLSAAVPIDVRGGELFAAFPADLCQSSRTLQRQRRRPRPNPAFCGIGIYNRLPC